MTFVSVFFEVASWVVGSLFFNGVSSLAVNGFTFESFVDMWVAVTSAVVVYFVARRAVEVINKKNQKECPRSRYFFPVTRSLLEGFLSLSHALPGRLQFLLPNSSL